jgi:formylglycine-generating enzyme required for sulfatase activity
VQNAMHIFISYAKADTYNLAIQLRDELRKLAGVTVWMDETLEPGESWALQIQQEIDAADSVIVLLSPDINRPISGTQHRSFVLNEIDYAQQENKPIIPIMAQPTRIPVQIAGVQYIDFTVDPTKGMISLIRKIARQGNVQPEIPTLKASKSSLPPTKSANRPPLFIAAILGLVVILLAIVAIPALTPLSTIQSPTLAQNSAPTVGDVQTGSPQTTPSDDLETQNAQALVNAQETILPQTLIVETQAEQDQEATRQANVAGTESATQSAVILTPVIHNVDWTPVYQTFDGIEMALVPPGCFMMGSENGQDIEKPVNQQCFEQPFWIDRYEVTNRQFGSEGYFNDYGDDTHPRDSVIWSEARDFCAGRNERLPTEREWEYAARGPDNWEYPWGNEFVEDNAIHESNSNSGSADVGSRHAGDSWVGASDLSGNLWEWVSTSLQPYPYAPDDGREDLGNETDLRVVRGGSWGLNYSAASSYHREGANPTEVNNEFGFRCARDY